MFHIVAHVFNLSAADVYMGKSLCGLKRKFVWENFIVALQTVCNNAMSIVLYCLRLYSSQDWNENNHL